MTTSVIYGCAILFLLAQSAVYILTDKKMIRKSLDEAKSNRDDIESIARFISEISTPSAITPVWHLTDGKAPDIDAGTVIRVIMRDGQDIESLPPFVFWGNSICYRVVSV